MNAPASPSADAKPFDNRSDVVLNLICGVSSWAVSMMLVPILAQHFLSRRPPISVWWLILAPALLCATVFIIIQFQTPRVRTAGRYAALGFALNCAFWWLLFHFYPALSHRTSPAIPSQPAARPLLIPNGQ